MHFGACVVKSGLKLIYLVQIENLGPNIQDNNYSPSTTRNPSLTWIQDVARNPNATRIQDVIRIPYPTRIEDVIKNPYPTRIEDIFDL